NHLFRRAKLPQCQLRLDQIHLLRTQSNIHHVTLLTKIPFLRIALISGKCDRRLQPIALPGAYSLIFESGTVLIL
ncbi:hypothetical protein, partial [Microcoleus sp. herbarium14]|uniref:hypothetical protein n=1 Tax=Microcoleus sp. herbarium14 TaxID=3055439 RepID=UPI002FD38742